jgi:L-ascorbate metabolism protein UlaG (beta-lactamase superfamily)
VIAGRSVVVVLMASVVAAAIGEIAVLFIPVGDGPTVGVESAAQVVRSLKPQLVVPMHYRTPAISFLDPPDAFLEALGAPVEAQAEPEFDPAILPGSSAETPTVVLLAPLLRS